MRRRRRHLEVSTFPFLAVLLCTMGSLILLLLVLDRRAKVVAMMKARNDVTAVQADKEKEEEERRRQEAEWEHKRQQLHALLAQQEEELLGQITDVRTQVSAAETKLQNAQAQVEQQKKQLHFATANLAGLQETLIAQQETAAKAEQQKETARRELERQAAALQQLEQTLASLKLLRERQKNTYSLVPYVGRRGDNRKPIYVECSDKGLTFHPNEVALEGFQLTGDRLRAEVEKRIASQPTLSSEKEPQRPYLLMLVRPDGIRTYYRAQEALAGMKLDFGYEFIDPDWVLDFSAEQGDGPRQPWMATAKLPGQSTPPAPPQPPIVNGGGFAAIPQAPGTSGKVGGNGSPGTSANQAGGSPIGSNSSQGGGGGGYGGWPAAAGLPKGVGGGGGVLPGSPGFPGGSGSGSAPVIGSPKGVGNSSGSSGMQGSAAGGVWQPNGTVAGGNGSPGKSGGLPPMPGGSGSAGGTGTADKSSPSTGNHAGSGQSVSGGTPSGQTGSGSKGVANPTGSGKGPGISEGSSSSPGNAGSNKGVASEPGNPTGGGGGSGNTGEASTGGGTGSGGVVLGPPALPGAKASPVTPPLGRILANRDWPIYIECTASGVTVKQGGEKFTIDVLAAPTKGEHPLVQTLRQMIERRQATVRAGEPPYRPLLRFQVRPDGMRAYYLAYPLLDTLRLPMARENLQNP